MSKILKLIFFLVFITSCSFHKNSNFWNKEKITLEKNKITKKIFKNQIGINLELNPNLKINITEALIKNSFVNNLDNNNGRINYDGNLKNKLKYKFSKIKNFKKVQLKFISSKSVTNSQFCVNKTMFLFQNK